MCKCNVKHTNFKAQVQRANKYTTDKNPYAVFFDINGTPYSKSIDSILKDDSITCMFIPVSEFEAKRTTKKEYIKNNIEVVADVVEPKKVKNVRKSKRTSGS